MRWAAHRAEGNSSLDKENTIRPQKNAEERLLAAYLKSLKQSSENEKHGLHYFDRPPELSEQDEEEEEAGEEDPDSFDMHSCSSTCCDRDCECDDCLRCSNVGTGETFLTQGVAG